jgi:para-nitrobenzyl esterase
MMPQEPKQRPLVETSLGPVYGAFDEASQQDRFLGIPYAEPPVDALRFRPPQPKAPWTAPRDCTRFGHSGVQIFDPSEGDYEEFTDALPGAIQERWVGNEDCLTLNIWRRAKGTANRPVLVWIHGGANALESSRLDIYHGDRFVARADVIFVSLNYRLGPFGWLDVSGIGGPVFRGSHSNGLRDQLLALTWIRDNIAAFGGDPANITVMGESAGSIDISWHLAAGKLQGIARRVVMMSGVAGVPGLTAPIPEEWSEAHGIEQANRFLSRLDITSLAQLQSLSTAEIMNRVVAVSAQSDTLFDLDSLYWPRVSDTYAPIDPFAAARQGLLAGIDIMIGCTDYEMGLWLNWDDTLDQHPVRHMADRLAVFSPEQRAEAAALYDQLFANDREGSRGMHLLGDILFRLPTAWFADEASSHGAKVWTYLFDWSVDDRRRALHAADQAFLFHKWETSAGRHLVGSHFNTDDAAHRDRTARCMQDAVLAFATSGNPNVDGNVDMPRWPNYETGQRAVMRFGRDVLIENDPAGARREWWTRSVYDKIVTDN